LRGKSRKREKSFLSEYRVYVKCRASIGDGFTIDYLCVLLVGDGVIRRQRLGKDVTAVTNTDASLEELLDASFSMRSVSYQRKEEMRSSKNFLFVYTLFECSDFMDKNLLTLLFINVTKHSV
jgi:hypothetical protein